MAEYSASTYAKTPEEKAYYLQYYRDYYRKGGNDKAGDAASKPSGNAAAAAALSSTKDGRGHPRLRGVGGGGS